MEDSNVSAFIAKLKSSLKKQKENQKTADYEIGQNKAAVVIMQMTIDNLLRDVKELQKQNISLDRTIAELTEKVTKNAHALKETDDRAKRDEEKIQELQTKAEATVHQIKLAKEKNWQTNSRVKALEKGGTQTAATASSSSPPPHRAERPQTRPDQGSSMDLIIHTLDDTICDKLTSLRDKFVFGVRGRVYESQNRDC
ncbi:unnamed protein product [Sympodiomycopsis kandeliae]